MNIYTKSTGQYPQRYALVCFLTFSRIKLVFLFMIRSGVVVAGVGGWGGLELTQFYMA